MIYTNKDFLPVEVELDFGKITQIQVGERGRGRKLIALTCPNDAKLKTGVNNDYTIGITKSGKPRINKSSKESLNEAYFLLSSEGRYTRRGDGIIYANEDLIKQNAVELLANGNGADGDAGRIGSWDVALLKIDISKNGCIAIRPGGYNYDLPIEYIVINDGQIYRSTSETVRDLCDELDIDCPEIFKNDEPTLSNFWNITKIEYAKEKIAEKEIFDINKIATSAESFNAAFEYALKKDVLFKLADIVEKLADMEISEETRSAILLKEQMVRKLNSYSVKKLLSNASEKTQKLFIKKDIETTTAFKEKGLPYDYLIFSYIEHIPVFNNPKLFNDSSFTDEEKRIIAEHSHGRIKFADPELIILAAKNTENDKQFELLSSIEDKEKYRNKIMELNIGKIIMGVENEELKEIIKQNPSLFKYIKNPNKEIYMTAIESLEVKTSSVYWGGSYYSDNNLDDILEIHPLKYVKNPDDEMIRAAVDKIPQVVSLVDINEKLQMEFLIKNEDIFKFFKNPSYEAQLYIADRLIEKPNPFKKLEELKTQIECKQTIMKQMLLNYINNGKDQEIVDYFNKCSSKDMIICFETLRKLNPEKFNTIAKQIKSGFFNETILDSYNLNSKKIRENLYNTGDELISAMTNAIYDAVNFDVLSSIKDIVKPNNYKDIILALGENLNEKEFKEIIERGFYYSKALNLVPEDQYKIHKIFDERHSYEYNKMLYKCVEFNLTNPTYKIDLEKATDCKVDYYYRKSYSITKLNAMLELAKLNINPIIAESLNDDEKIKAVLEMIKTKTLDMSIFTKKELEAIQGGLVNFKNWHRTGGQTNLSETFVITASGDMLPPDANDLANPNHRHHYQTEQGCIEGADGTQKWNNIPIDSIVITYSKMNSSTPYEFEVKWMPKKLTKQQQETIRNELKFYINCHNKTDPNNLLNIIARTNPSELNGVSLKELTQYSTSLNKINFDADIDTVLRQLNEIKEAKKISEEIILPNKTQGGDAI